MAELFASGAAVKGAPLRPASGSPLTAAPDVKQSYQARDSPRSRRWTGVLHFICETAKANGEKQAAVLLKMIVIGEAATRILQRHPDFIDLHPEMPWRGMRAMRNHTVHGYFSIDYDLVWDAISGALPSLIARLPSVRGELEGRERDSGA